MHAVILGSGRVGAALSARLLGDGHSVSVIDRNPRSRGGLGGGFTGKFLVGSGIDRKLLELAGITEAEAFVAVTSSDSANIVAARTARDVYRVPRVMARIYDPRRAELYRELGIMTVAQVRWAVHQFVQLLFQAEVAPLHSFGNGETVLVQASVAANLAGRRIGELEIAGAIRAVELTRAGRSAVAVPDTELATGDMVSFAVTQGELARFQAFLGGGAKVAGRAGK